MGLCGASPMEKASPGPSQKLIAEDELAGLGYHRPRHLYGAPSVFFKRGEITPRKTHPRL